MTHLNSFESISSYRRLCCYVAFRVSIVH